MRLFTAILTALCLQVIGVFCAVVAISGANIDVAAPGTKIAHADWML